VLGRHDPEAWEFVFILDPRRKRKVIVRAHMTCQLARVRTWMEIQNVLEDNAACPKPLEFRTE